MERVVEKYVYAYASIAQRQMTMQRSVEEAEHD